jgi:hypothetical protein
MANTAFTGKYTTLERKATACRPALDGFPPSLGTLEGTAVLSWLQADGAIVTVHNARIMNAATSLQPEAAQRRADDAYVFTGNPPFSTK